MPNTFGIRPHTLTYIAPIVFAGVGGVVGSWVAGLYSASNTNKVVPSGKPEFDAEAMIRAAVDPIVERILSSNDTKVSDDEVNIAAAKILDIVSDVMASHIRFSNAAEVSGYIDPAITSKVEEAPIKKEMELVNHSDTQKQIEAGKPYIDPAITSKVEEAPIKEEMELVNHSDIRKQIEAGKPYAEFIHEFGLYSIEAQLALKMKIAEVPINREVSCEKVCRELNISGEARLKLEMMIVELPRIREMIQEGWLYKDIIYTLDIYTDEAQSALEMMFAELYRTRNIEAASSRWAELKNKPVVAKTNLLPHQLAATKSVEDDSVISPNQHTDYYHRLNKKLVNSKISSFFYHTEQPHFYQFLMRSFSPKGQFTFINPKTLSNIYSIDISRITDEKLFIMATYHSTFGEAFGELISFNEFQQALLAEIHGRTGQKTITDTPKQFSLIEKQKQLEQFITDKITRLTPQSGSWIELNDTVQLDNLIKLAVAAPRIFSAQILIGYSHLDGHSLNVNLPNLKGRQVYVRQTFPSFPSQSQFEWYQVKIGKNAEAKYTENDSSKFNFRALEAHLRKKEALEKHSDNENYVKQSEKSLKPEIITNYVKQSEKSLKPEITTIGGTTAVVFAGVAGGIVGSLLFGLYSVSNTNNVVPSGGAFINAVDPNGRTALYVAAWFGHLTAVQTLVATGADVNIADVNGLTPLRVAIQNGYAEVADYLIRVGASSGTS